MRKRSSVTIKDIAEASGVSYPTVSYVLNNSRVVSPETRKRVLDTVKRLNYHPSAIARGLLKHRMNTIGVVMPYTTDFVISDPYLGPIIEAILIVALHHKQTVMIFPNKRGDGFSALDHVGLYCDGRCDGLIFIHDRTDSELITTMRQKQIPIVCLNELVIGSDVAGVDVAQVEGAQALATYLLSLGHRRIAFLAGEDSVLSVAQRYEGFRQAYRIWGLTPDPDLILPGTYFTESGYERTIALMTRTELSARPTALYCCNDRIALGAMSALTSLGIRVPEDISVVGFDDTPAGAMHRPALTTMHLPFRDTGTRAAELLLEHIASGENPAVQEFLPMTLVERESVAPVGAQRNR